MRIMVGLDLSVKTLMVILMNASFLLATMGGYLSGRGEDPGGLILTALAVIAVVVCHRLALIQHRNIVHLMGHHEPEAEPEGEEHVD